MAVGGPPNQRLHRAFWTAVIGASSAVYLVIGQLSEEGGSDFILRAPQLSRHLEIALGVCALLVTIGAAATAWPLLRMGWWQVYGRLLLIGLIAAVGLRIITAASSGANIGGGMIMFVYPIPLAFFAGRTAVIARGLHSGGYTYPHRVPAGDWPVLVFVLVVTALMATD